MSVVTGVILSMSVCEEGPGEDTPPPVVALNAWLREEGWGPLTAIDEAFGGGKHPQMHVYGCGYNAFFEDEFLAHVQTAPWRYPANVVLVINPETGPARVWQGQGDHA